MAATVDRYRGDILEDERDRTLRALEGIRDGGHVGTRYGENIGGLDGESERSLAGNEDLFLNLARATSTRQGPAESSSSRSERRRSRISLANHRQSPPQTEYSSPSTRHLSNGGSPVDQTPSPSQPQYTSEDRWQHQQQDQRSLTALHTPSPLQYRPSTKARSFAASAHPLDDSGRSRYFGVIPKSSFSIPRGHVKREISPESPQYNGRRSSPSDLANVHVPVRAHRQSNLSYSALRNQYPSPLANHITEMDRDQIPNTPRADGTESTVSTTAPSTVWDELDDMKSRIRKLELTGKLPPSSGAAISSASGERPRTATTTVTTISSSPKHGRGKSNSPPSSAIGGPGAASIHPLLHAALAKCKPLISSDVYRALEATASDSLSLAAMMGSGCPQGTMHSAVSVLGGSSIADRHVRRKADSMCRSLTELCIALSDDKSDLASPAINGSGCVRLNGEDRGSEQDVGASGSPYQRASSQEPAEHTNPRSIMSRLEARRTSILSLNSINGHRGQARDSSTPTQTPTGPSIPRRLSRAPTVLLGARRTEDTDDNSEARPLSRATTELGPSRSSPRERVSKEYTSRLTLPHQSSRSPSLQSSLPVRRNYLTNSQALSTPNIQPGSRRYLDRSTQPATDNGSRLAEARQQRIASAGQNNTSARQRRGSLDGSGSLVGRRLRQASAEPRVEEQAEGYQQR
ncbi:MAG: hypothetical protein M1830_005999 [Pleopsidium flavum]|nr:MAG: hypothetical protein M1830_005999 [Pleopsidium flavum]